MSAHDFALLLRRGYSERRHLIAARKSVEEVREFIDADSLAYLSLEGLRASCGEPVGDPQYCTSCYTGKYPTNYVDLQQIRPAAAVAK